LRLPPDSLYDASGGLGTHHALPEDLCLNSRAKAGAPQLAAKSALSSGAFHLAHFNRAGDKRALFLREE
jgi:hypothetical protein